ncbi:hypothetical protein TIFTF001_031474 [Ficus carica]|uniref:Uncharacterized protein n=1 Tax=Ficus carica TaxID=3494 RepID=A0AA88J487_FICCA|nr:hypothetical protein TIFTF001_031474 [Ficus carica]
MYWTAALKFEHCSPHCCCYGTYESALQPWNPKLQCLVAIQNFEALQGFSFQIQSCSLDNLQGHSVQGRTFFSGDKWGGAGMVAVGCSPLRIAGVQIWEEISDLIWAIIDLATSATIPQVVVWVVGLRRHGQRRRGLDGW